VAYRASLTREARSPPRAPWPFPTTFRSRAGASQDGGGARRGAPRSTPGGVSGAKGSAAHPAPVWLRIELHPLRVAYDARRNEFLTGLSGRSARPSNGAAAACVYARDASFGRVVVCGGVRRSRAGVAAGRARRYEGLAAGERERRTLVIYRVSYAQRNVLVSDGINAMPPRRARAQVRLPAPVLGRANDVCHRG